MKPWTTELLDSSCEKWMFGGCCCCPIFNDRFRQAKAAVSGHVLSLLYICVDRRKACNDIKLYIYIFVHVISLTVNIHISCSWQHFNCLTPVQGLFKQIYTAQLKKTNNQTVRHQPDTQKAFQSVSWNLWSFSAMHDQIFRMQKLRLNGTNVFYFSSALQVAWQQFVLTFSAGHFCWMNLAMLIFRGVK